MPLFWWAFSVVAILASCSRPRGVDPDNLAAYSGDTFECLSGDVFIPITSVNDNYCDCPDGSDEPGTSACSSSFTEPRKTFYCPNLGNFPKYIFSSRVDDGVCDCCDGSDEPAGVCPDTCRSDGEALLASSKEKLERIRRALEIRAAYVARADLELGEKEQRLEELKKRKSELDPILEDIISRKDRLERIEEIEAKRKRQRRPPPRRPHKKPSKSSEKKDKKEKSPPSAEMVPEADPSVVVGSPPVAAAVSVVAEIVDISETNVLEEKQGEAPTVSSDSDEGVEEEDEDVDLSSLEDSSREELLNRIAILRSRIAELEEEINSQDAQIAALDEQLLSSESDLDEADDELFSYDDYDDDEKMGFFGRIWWVMKWAWYSFVRLFYGSYDLSEADLARKEYKRYHNEDEALTKQIEELSKVVDGDYGPDRVYYALRDQCYSKQDKKKYSYEICLFGKAQQKEKDRSGINLGQWKKFTDRDDEEEQGDPNYDVFRFRKGQKCWNGPDRSVTATVICGVEERLSKIDEPSTCRYTAVFETPAACRQEDYIELQKRVKMLERTKG